MPSATGTVTFLFTDIEGSTRLLEQNADTAREAMGRHDALLSEVVARHGGEVFKTVGDAFCVVFGSARDALLTAIEAARELRSLPLRVRMALHTGTVESRQGDYFGLQLSRVSRLLSAGHGGQVLLSRAVYELVRDDLPDGVTLKDLGLHRLKDLQRPEHVYCLAHPDIEDDFPPIRSLDHLPNNLPHQLTSFVGRERELRDLRRELEDVSLLTLTGPGGCGKSRLALQVAALALDDFPGGVWLVELASLADPHGVPGAVAKALGLREEAGRPLEETLADYLCAKPHLLVIDNCEHLIAACADLVSRLLRTCPTLRILATSQESLGVAGESVRLVPPLGLPESHDLQTVGQAEATRLFVARATAAVKDFVLDDATAAAVAKVCERLDGIPLALELAAAMMGSISVEEMGDRIGSSARFGMLQRGDPTTLPKHRTLESMIDWSHELLTDRDAVLFRRLACFVGGWSLEAAEEVCEDSFVLSDLARLVKKSLVVAESRRTLTHYRFLETIRQYALGRLRDSGEETRFRNRHRDYFLNLAQRAETGMAGPDITVWLDRLETNLDNLRAAFRTCLEDDEGTEFGLRLVGSLWRFWRLRGDLSEGREWFREALARKGGPTAARAKALFGAGALALHQDDYEEARSLYEACREIYEARDDMTGLGDAFHGLARVAGAFGDYETARDLYGKALDKRRFAGDELGQAASLNNLGLIAFETGDLESADRLLTESLDIETRLGNVGGVASSLSNLAAVALARGNDEAAHGFAERALYMTERSGDRLGIAEATNKLAAVELSKGADEAARLYAERALLLHEQSGNRLGIAEARRHMAEVRRRQGELAAAYRLCEASLSTYLSLGDRRGVAELFDLAAALMWDLGDAPAAACLMGAAEALRESFGWRLPPVERRSHDALRRAVDGAMDSEAFKAALEEGSRMSPQEAFARTFAHAIVQHHPATNREANPLEAVDR